MLIERSNFALADVISINDFSLNDINFILSQASRLEAMRIAEKNSLLSGKVVASLFFEPSTRTRLSFETAAQNLGAKVVGFSDANATSQKKGETLSDTIRMVEKYSDVIVMRHPLDGSARRAAEVSAKPVINAGDGSNQHPTQTLLDLYTMRKEFGKIDGLKIGMLGDLKYGRTVHSLAVALGMFEGIELYFIAPGMLKMPEHITNAIKDRVKIRESSELHEFLPELDVLYATRIQKERFADPLEYERIKDVYILTKEILQRTKSGFRIMHPLPRINEISNELDETDAALYFQQAANGIPVREAILNTLGNEK